MAIADKLVVISLQDLSAGVTVTDQKTVLVLAGGVKPTSFGTATTKTYTDSETVGTDFGTTSVPYYIARSGFSQDQFPESVTYASYGATVSATVVEAALVAALAEGREFYHVICDFTDSASLTALSTWCALHNRVLHADSADADILDAVETTDICSVLNAAEKTRVAIYYHAIATESYCAATVFSRCGLDPVRGTWAHKGLVGITPDALTDAQYLAAKAKGANMYVKISASDNRTLFGTFTDGDYIDRIMKKDWVLNNVRAAILDSLKNSNDGYGIEQDDGGIATVAAAISTTLAYGADDNHRYVKTDYSVTTPKYSDLSTVEKTERVLPYVKFYFTPLGAFHTVNPVTGYVTA